MEGVQDLYLTMKNMDFSLEDYEAIIDLYNSKVRERERELSICQIFHLSESLIQLVGTYLFFSPDV